MASDGQVLQKACKATDEVLNLFRGTPWMSKELPEFCAGILHTEGVGLPPPQPTAENTQEEPAANPNRMDIDGGEQPTAENPQDQAAQAEDPDPSAEAAEEPRPKLVPDSPVVHVWLACCLPQCVNWVFCCKHLVTLEDWAAKPQWISPDV